MKWFVSIFISVCLNTIIVLRGRGDFGAIVLTMLASIWIGLPLILPSAICYAISAQYKMRRFRNVSAYGLLASLVIASTLISIPAGMCIHKHDIRTAKVYCEELITKIELIKNNTGAYPVEVMSLHNAQELPRLVNTRTYQSDGTNFSFKILTNVHGGDMFSSQRREWVPWE